MNHLIIILVYIKVTYDIKVKYVNISNKNSLLNTNNVYM